MHRTQSPPITCSPQSRLAFGKGKASETEGGNRLRRLARQRQIGEGFTDDGSGLEAVSRTGGGQPHPRLLGVVVQDKMLVWSVGEEADLHG